MRGRAYGVMQRRGLSTKLLFSTNQENCPQLFKDEQKLATTLKNSIGNIAKNE